MATPAVAQRPPFEVVRELLAAQDDISSDEKSIEAKREALSREFERSTIQGEQVWSDPRNRRALVAFLFRGGGVGPGYERASASAGDQERALLDGAIAVAEGRNQDAVGLMKNVDLRIAPASIAGPAALALAPDDR